MALERLTSSRLSVRSSTALLDFQKKISEVRVTVAPAARLLYFFINDGGQPRTFHIKLSHGASVTLYGICIGAASGEQKTDVSIEHASPQSTSFVSLKGVFMGESKGIINGTIRIHKAAQGSNARLEERVLLLSSGASAKTIPNLEIEANDVKASHAATVSRLSEDEIFYLQTRGLTREQCIQELIRAFLASQLIHLPEAKMRDKLVADILTKTVARKQKI